MIGAQARYSTIVTALHRLHSVLGCYVVSDLLFVAGYLTIAKAQCCLSCTVYTRIVISMLITKPFTFWKRKHIAKRNHVLKMKAHSETHFENENIFLEKWKVMNLFDVFWIKNCNFGHSGLAGLGGSGSSLSLSLKPAWEETHQVFVVERKSEREPYRG